MRLNISQLLDYQRCPVFWHNRYVEKRGAPPYEGALSDGTYWHTLAEAWLKGEPLLPPAENPTQDAMRKFVEDGNLPRIPTVAIEHVLEMPLGRHTLIGRLDGIEPISDMPGWFDSLQWKTCAGGQDEERQQDAVRWSYHEVAYEALMNHNGFPCRGTHLGMFKKLTKDARAAGVWPLKFSILTRPPEYVTRVLREIEGWADRMEQHIGQPNALPLTPHRKNCILGFARCQYWKPCYEGMPLSDPSFVTLESRYPGGENAQAQEDS